ncbi:hypothetical protein RchiOBHm_Chr5g0074591 [Rosa chinensis]|uniref:Uncharacterized protein n=1 Tax=Rosa chinensis TaxID=74649 RepID=A0A2P6QL85_ROSCH|nr:hypothetical protein RchiOBHm_Chr5g0074591 [Rosa chinensis]
MWLQLSYPVLLTKIDSLLFVAVMLILCFGSTINFLIHITYSKSCHGSLMLSM